MTMNHVSALVDLQVEKLGADFVVLKYRNDKGEWIDITWGQLQADVRLAANALAVLGVQEEENVGIFSQNKPESFVVDFADMYNRAVTVPLYATSSPSQTQYIVSDAGIRVLFVGEQYQYDTVMQVLPQCHSLEKIVIYDHKVTRHPGDKISVYFDEFLHMGDGLPKNDLVMERKAKGKAEDLIWLLYTSGTTGEPKGVQLLHASLLDQFQNHRARLGAQMQRGDVSLSFLPLTHVFERGWSYVCLYEGITIAVNLRPQEVQQAIREVHPTHMCSVPRFWEKVYIGVQQKIAGESGVRKAMMENAIKVGKEYNVDYLNQGKKPPMWLSLKYKFYEKTVINTLKKVLGLENAKFFPTAGAAVSAEVCEFVHAVGINMIVGYGLTESFATVSCYPLEHYVPGSVGLLIDSIKVKIDPENEEILLKGPTIMKGYYKKVEANREAFTADGYFRTGDTGYLKGRTLFLKERIKDLMKTSNGKYVSPQALEAKLGIDRFVEQVAIVADGRKFVSALIVPNYEALKEFATQKGISYDTIEELLKHPRVQDLYQTRIDTLQQEFAHYEQIKRFTLLPEPFSMENGELTNTLKLRRSVVAQNYKTLIDKMYEENG
ncbi:MAG: long-chain fatty acid--CoA ligase [Bacteroidaceae bacterium]|nr:long-chain fatty acid--CoA ligase [Bacteroidaceae bacterium]